MIKKGWNHCLLETNKNILIRGCVEQIGNSSFHPWRVNKLSHTNKFKQTPSPHLIFHLGFNGLSLLKLSNTTIIFRPLSAVIRLSICGWRSSNWCRRRHSRRYGRNGRRLTYGWRLAGRCFIFRLKKIQDDGCYSTCTHFTMPKLQSHTRGSSNDGLLHQQ